MAEKQPLLAEASFREENGVIVGSDRRLEWLLPWWWEHYSRENSFPVAFFDFGMSSKARQWCADKGQVISHTVDDSFIRPMDPSAQAYLAPLKFSMLKYMLQSRDVWLQKPLVCLKSPFLHTLWLDIDCEVYGNLFKVFSYLYQEGCDFAICKDTDKKIEKLRYLKMIEPGQIGYSSAVFAFKRGSEILNKWVQEVVGACKKHVGDQNALTHVLLNSGEPFQIMPQEFNWHCIVPLPKNPVFVRHWPGWIGKKLIRKRMK